MNPLKDFFEAERKRVFAPDAFFTQRVMARLDERRSDAEIWEMVPSSSRPVLAFALVLILCFVFLEVFVPREPERGMVEAYLETDQSPVESFLYSEPDLPSHQEVLQQVIALEEEQ